MAMATRPMVGGARPAALSCSVSASAKWKHTAEKVSRLSGSDAGSAAASRSARQGCSGGAPPFSPCVCESPDMSRMLSSAPAAMAAKDELRA